VAQNKKEVGFEDDAEQRNRQRESRNALVQAGSASERNGERDVWLAGERLT
jgi:hypothetical protein